MAEQGEICSDHILKKEQKKKTVASFHGYIQLKAMNHSIWKDISLPDLLH